MRIVPVIVSFLLFFCSVSFAGYESNTGGSDYDLDTGVYIKVVTSSGYGNSDLSSKVSNDYAVNLFVFNPKNNTYRHLLNKNYGQITSYVIETAFKKNDLQDVNKSSISGNYQYLSGNEHVQNNVDIAQRAINSHIIIETYSDKTKLYTVWKANKLSGSAEVIFSYNQPASWHLDVKNQQIRLITSGIENKQIRLRIKSYAW